MLKQYKLLQARLSAGIAPAKTGAFIKDCESLFRLAKKHSRVYLAGLVKALAQDCILLEMSRNVAWL